MILKRNNVLEEKLNEFIIRNKTINKSKMNNKKPYNKVLKEQ